MYFNKATFEQPRPGCFLHNLQHIAVMRESNIFAWTFEKGKVKVKGIKGDNFKMSCGKT